MIDIRSKRLYARWLRIDSLQFLRLVQAAACKLIVMSVIQIPSCSRIRNQFTVASVLKSENGKVALLITLLNSSDLNSLT